MSDQGTEMAARKGSGNTPVWIEKDGEQYLVGDNADEEEMWIYRARGTPRSFKCGSGQCLRVNLNPCVFLFATVLIWTVIIWGTADSDGFAAEFHEMKLNISKYWTWFYVGGLNVFMIFCFWVGLSKYGDILLAPPDSPEPDFPYYTWFSMLFSAGVGVGLFFYGVSEPLWFFGTLTRENVQYLSNDCHTSNWDDTNKCFTPDSRYDRALSGMNIAWFDWGFSASSCYVVFGLPLAFYHYRYDMPLSVRSAFYPLIGNRIYGWFGDIVDGFCIVGTIMGLCTSLGLGVNQMVGNMNVYNERIHNTWKTQVVTIVGITAVATVSVVTGLDVGIRRLSEVNFTLGLILMLMVFYMGEPEFYLDFFVQMIGYHIQQLPHTSFATGALENHMGRHPDSMVHTAQKSTQSLAEYYSAGYNYVKPVWNTYLSGGAGVNGNSGGGFENGWTIFYWGWWISWSPFVGTFLARISKGRTIKEFIIGNMIVPTIMTSIWFSIFGGSGYLMAFKSENLRLDCCKAPYMESTSFKPVNTTYDDVEGCYKEWMVFQSTLPKDACIGPFDPCDIGEWDRTIYYHSSNWTGDAGNALASSQYVYDESGSIIATEHTKRTNKKFLNVVCRIGNLWYNDPILLTDVLKWMWLPQFTILLAIIGLFTYFITSSDSASQVSDMISSNGEKEPPYWQRIYWAISEGLVAIVLVMTGRDGDKVSNKALKSIQAASIVAGFPLAFIMLMLCFSMYKGLVFEMAIIEGKPLPPQKRFKVPLVDSFVQLYGRCLFGIGALWMTNPKASDMNECLMACVSWFCPCLVLWKIAVSSAQSAVAKGAYAFAIFVPYILIAVWYGLCPDYIEWFDTKKMKTEGKSYMDGFGCDDRGYVGFFGVTWVIISFISSFVRIGVRNKYGISGSAGCDCLIFFMFPSVAVYQSLKQLGENPQEATPMSGDWADDKDKDPKGATSSDAPVGNV